MTIELLKLVTIEGHVDSGLGFFFYFAFFNQYLRNKSGKNFLKKSDSFQSYQSDWRNL
jgi:hypothetical protein